MIGYLTKNIPSLPHPSVMRLNVTRAAFVEAMIQVDENWRVFNYRVNWQAHADLCMVDNRQGDSFTIAFSHYGVICCGFNKDSPIAVNTPDRLEESLVGPDSIVPHDLWRLLVRHPFNHGGRTIAFWYSAGRWQCPRLLLEDHDCADFIVPLLNIVAYGKTAFVEWATEYYDNNLICNICDVVYDQDAIDIAALSTICELSAETVRRIAYKCGLHVS